MTNDALKRRADAFGVFCFQQAVPIVDGQLDKHHVRATGDHPVGHHEREHLGAAVAAEAAPPPP